MIKPIVRDTFFLARKSAEATQDDLQTAIDLMDTLAAHQNECAGMAANMIGASKRIIAVYAGPAILVMFNPVIIEKSGQYETEEGCLSLSGMRRTKRYRKIKVKYRDMEFRVTERTFTEWTAQVIQHEIDHLEGILI